MRKGGGGIKTCFFIGHRDAPDSILPMLAQTVNRHITKYGVTEFVVGHYGAFDRLAARAVRDAKERYPEIILTMLLPYHPYDRPISTPKGFDNTFYPPGMEAVPKKVAIVRANRYMVEHIDHLIAYVWHSASNSREILDAARRRETRGLMHVINLYDCELEQRL